MAFYSCNNADTLYNAIFSKVHQFLSRRDFVLSFDTIKLIAEGIVLKFVTLSTIDEVFSKSDFEKILLKWVEEFYGGKKQNRQINIGFVNSGGNPTKDICFKKIKYDSINILNILRDQIMQQIEEVKLIHLIPNEIFDYSPRTVASGPIYEQTIYGQISKDDYYSPFSPFALTSKPKDAEKIKNFTNDDIEAMQDFGNLLFRMPSASTGPKIIGTESELNKYAEYSKLITLIDKYECIASYLHANDEYDVLSMFVTNDSRIAHNNIQLTISIRPVLDFLRESKRFKTENQSTVDFLMEHSEDLLVLLREPLQINFSEYDNYGVFPIHISDKVVSAHRSFNGKPDFDLNYLKRYLTCLLSYEHVQLTRDTLVFKVTFKKLRSGEKMLFPSYLLIRANDDIVIDVEIISDELDKKITMHFA